jgi:hypothetical protein
MNPWHLFALAAVAVLLVSAPLWDPAVLEQVWITVVQLLLYTSPLIGAALAGMIPLFVMWCHGEVE